MTDIDKAGARDLVSVIVPVLGNCPSITPTLHLIHSALHDAYDYEVLVVADTSTPGPAARDTRMFALDHDARVALHELPGQKVTAIKHGMAQARGSIVGYIDGDAGWEATPENLRAVVDAVAWGDSDCACAQRNRAHWSPLRRAKTGLFAWIAGLLFRLPIADTQAPMKFFARPAIDVLLEHAAWKGWEFDVDLLWVLTTAGFRTRPIPVTWTSNGGEAGWVSILLLASMAPGMIRNLVVLRVGTRRRARRIRINGPSASAEGIPQDNRGHATG